MHRRLMLACFALTLLAIDGQALLAQSYSQNQSAGNPQTAAPQNTIQVPQSNYAPQVPPGFPLDENQQAFIEKVLDHWQANSQSIKRSSADFRSWDYDPEFCNFRDPKNNKLAAFKVQDGHIRFSSPDKGQYEVNKLWIFDKKLNGDGAEESSYNPIETDSVHEKWICDGKSVYEYDFENKKLYETAIPPEMQGNNIVNSPLPFFLFGADKQKMLSKYWLRAVTPQGAENEVWLEAYPKTLEDARSYRKLEIILSLEDFLPRSLHVYAPNYDPVRNPQSRAFEFRNRKMNDQLAGIRDFFGLFVRPSKPIGFEWVERKVPQTNQAQIPGAIQDPNATRR